MLKLGDVITVKDLREKGAGCDDLERFIEVFGEQVMVTEENILLATKEGLNVEWFASVFLSDEQYKVYEKARASHWADFKKAVDTHWAGYLKATAPHWEIFVKAKVPHLEVYKKAVASHRGVYLKAVAFSLIKILKGEG